MFAETQQHFATALLDAGRPVPAMLTSHTGPRPARRFAVYRNNVVASLVTALRTRFPACERIVGAEFFAAMGRVFVTEQPPASPLLMVYGDAFPDFIAGFAPAQDMPYLADVARIEAARTRAYHAADATPIDPARLAKLAPEAFAATRFVLHPSVETVRSAYPVVTIWAMNAGDAALAPIADWRGEDAVIARPALDVEVRALPPGGAAFLLALAEGRPMAEAVQSAIADDGTFDLVANLAGLIGAGLASDLSIPATPEPDR